MTRPDGTLPGVPWQELARRYEVALRDIMKRHENGKCTCGGCCIARAALTDDWRPAPSATTAETAYAPRYATVRMVPHDPNLDPGPHYINATLRPAAAPPSTTAETCAKCGGAEHRCLRGELHECPHLAPSTTAETCAECGHSRSAHGGEAPIFCPSGSTGSGYFIAQPAPPSSAAHDCTHLRSDCCAGVCIHSVSCTHGACCHECWRERCPENAKTESVGGATADATATALHGHVLQLERDLATARAEVERLTRERDALEAKTKRQSSRIRGTEERNESLQHRHRILERSIDRITGALDRQYDQIKQVAARCDELRAERDAATKRAESMTEVANTASAREMEARKQRDEAEQRCAREIEHAALMRDRAQAHAIEIIELKQQRAETEAACAAMREALNHCVEALTNHEVFPCGHSGDGDGPECFHDCGRCAAEEALAHAEEASTSNAGAALLRERDELRAERYRAVAERDGLKELIREALDDRHVVCDAKFDDEGESVCIGAECMRERMRAALTPPALSDDNGGGNV